MNVEYLLFNLVVAAGPVMASFDRRVRYVRRWPRALLASAIVAVPYLVWDALVAGRHWDFVHGRTLDLRIAGLPPGEILFFITVPFACLFVWEILRTFWPGRELPDLRWVPWTLMALIPLGVLLLLFGVEYTGLALIALGLAAALDRLLGTRLLHNPTAWNWLGIVLLLVLIFNTYLTARPIVVYADAYRVMVRLGTIPLEDFVYGLSHLLLVVVVYERLGRLRG